MSESCLVVDGNALGTYLATEARRQAFVTAAARAPAVVCCRVSPTQKAQVVELIAAHTGKVTAAIGDGGNDVSMIQAAHVGFGIVGKEGRQASLASDFSLLEFRAVLRLVLYHGRHSYKHSARLAQFVIHRGLVISFMQAVFSALYSFAAIALFSGWLLVGYSTAWTSLPVFCLILDEDIGEKYVFEFPELYSALRKGRALSLKTFAYWVLRSLYQAGVAMVLSIALFDDQFTHIVAISFTVLIIVELLNIIVEVNRVHWLMWVAQGFTLVSYLVSMALLPTYFDMGFVLTWPFWWKTAAIAWVAMLPVVVVKTVKRRCFPPVYKKLG
jgi:phospholipid-translocating ATPase